MFYLILALFRRSDRAGAHAIRRESDSVFFEMSQPFVLLGLLGVALSILAIPFAVVLLRKLQRLRETHPNWAHVVLIMYLIKKCSSNVVALPAQQFSLCLRRLHCSEYLIRNMR